MTLLHIHSHHPLSCKEGIINSQALRYNMIISEDHILQAELNKLTRTLLACAYPLHLIIKKNKKSLDPQPQLPVIPTNTTYRDQHSPHYNPFLRHGQTTHNHHTQKLAHCCQRHHSPPSGHPKLYQPTPNPTVFITTLFTLHKHMVPHSKTCKTYDASPLPTHTHTHQYGYTHSGHTRFLLNTRHTQLILMPWTMNSTSRHPMKILISNDYETHQRPHPHAVNLGSSVTHC